MTLWNEKFKEMPLVAILRGLSPEEAIDVSTVLVEAGIKILEVPLNSPNPLESISKMKAHFMDQAIIGAGTVLTGEAAKQVHDNGGELIVAPNLNADVAAMSKKCGMIYCPGILTPTEAFNALALGADALKIFPADAHPPSYIKSIRAVLPRDTTIIPTGGVEPDTIATYYQVGANGFGAGSSLYKPGKSLNEIAEMAAKLVSATKDVIHP
ncbi:2-dehydro-3-deoxy-6-phosphogalactonate aldolase [Pseudemcibacter sp.]|jgi:2-dehydro-3-deoxyphosphogalactonate aldolase|uniref:2-dehydro-3-deoxy-6-phosphogalactonate aldolase n=1 Tax=Pseudemcibacter sp. TaxID=2943293 RepID=UPI003F697BBD|nr:2-dehydro-3-deoxy-6-phosphogalactonate aldolase [Kordiimonadaceae bacterium]